jgi:hypothetical protein
MRFAFVLSVCAMLLLGLTSCQKIDQAPSAGVPMGPLALELSQTGDGIPLAYGQLVGVTPDPHVPWQAVLWFEAPDESVTAVWVNTGKRRVVGSLKIPRR